MNQHQTQRYNQNNMLGSILKQISEYVKGKKVFLILAWGVLLCTSQGIQAQSLIIADSAFKEIEPGYIIYKQSPNIHWVIDSVEDENKDSYWMMSPIGVEWRGNYWGG